MKKRPENELLNDLFPKGRDLRATSLERTLFSARQQRRRRKAVRIGGVATICLGLLVVALNSRVKMDRPASQLASVNRALSTETDFQTVPGTSIRIINDEELLALFADRPVALIGPPEERRFVVLDELRKEKTDGVLN